MLLYFIQGLGLGGSAAATPGPFQAFLLSQTLRNGWRRTLPASLAPLLSDGPIVALVLLLLTQTPTWFLILLRLLGGLFILYLAWGAYHAARTVSFDLAEIADSPQRNLFKAVIMNSLNPNPYIFWGLIAGPILLDAWRRSPGLGISFVLGFYGTLVGGFAAFIILFGVARRLGPRVIRALSWVSALALFGFGLYQIWYGLTMLG